MHPQQKPFEVSCVESEKRKSFRRRNGFVRVGFSGAKELGLTLLEVIVSLGILSAASVGLVNLASRYSQDTLNSVSASQFRTFGQASNAYIKDNYAAIQAIATPTAPAIVTVGTLIASGKLPAGYSAVNASGQTLCTLVLEPTVNRLQAMVVGEGSPANDLDLGSLASTIGGSGGGVYSTANTIIRGAVGAWSVPAATFDNLVNNAGTTCSGAAGNVRVVTGTPVMALWFENGDANSAFVSRDAVPGRPDLSSMNTPLLMNAVQTLNGACTTVGSIARDSAGAVVSCQGGVWKAQGSSFWADPVATFASLPVCNVALAGQTRIVQTPTVGSGPRAASCNGSSWIALAVDDNGNLVAPGTVTGGKVQTTAGTSGSASSSFFDMGASRIAANTSIYSYGRICSQNSSGDCTGTGGTVINGGSVTAAGTVAANAITSSTSTITYGNTYNMADTWAFLGYGAGGAANASPQSATGSAYVNDVYIRSIGKWASQLNTAGGNGLNSGAAGTFCDGRRYCNRGSGNGICFLYYGSFGYGPVYANFIVWNGSSYGTQNGADYYSCDGGVLWGSNG